MTGQPSFFNAISTQVDRSQLIDELEELKQGLSNLLAQNEKPGIEGLSGNTSSGGSASIITPSSNDVSLLENFQIISTSRNIIGNGKNGIDENIDQQGQQTLIILDNQHKIVAFNRSAESNIQALSGRQLTIGGIIEDFLPGTNQQDFEGLIQQALEGVSLHLTSQIGFERSPKQWHEINLFPVRDSNSEITRLVWCMEDIQERKAAQENLRALEINFQSVFKQAAVSVVLSNTNLQVIQANRRFYELIEYTPKEYKSLPPLSITHPRDLAESKRLLNLLCKGEIDSFSLEKRLITKTGKVIWVFLTTNIIKDRKRKPKLIISVAQDITDRKHAEQELIFKNNELDTFIYRASHDLRGPVASLLGLYNVVQTEFDEDTHAMKYFEHYHKSVLRLNKILHNLIDLTKIKEKEINPSEVDLNDIISNCLSSLSNIEHFENIHFKIRNEVDFKLHTDANSIGTILFHLLENAVNFIQLNNPQPFVKLDVKHESNFLIIEVTDNGVGIKKELQSEVFNMFYRANERSTGSGLGLYIVRYAVEKLNGSIQLKSKEMSGTKISVYLPYSSGNLMSVTKGSAGDNDPQADAKEKANFNSKASSG